MIWWFLAVTSTVPQADKKVKAGGYIIITRFYLIENITKTHSDIVKLFIVITGDKITYNHAECLTSIIIAIDMNIGDFYATHNNHADIVNLLI